MARLTTLTFDQTSAYITYDNNAILPVLLHCLDPAKAPHRYIGSYHINIQRATSKTHLLSNSLAKSADRIFHFVLTLSQQEQHDLINQTSDNINMELYKIADDIAYSIAKNYQVIYAVHEDDFAPHIHFIIISNSSINYNSSHAYNGYDCELFIRNYLYHHYGFQLHVRNHGKYYSKMQYLRGPHECSLDWIKHCISKRGLLDDTRSGVL